jgi:hypothetical protein
MDLINQALIAFEDIHAVAFGNYVLQQNQKVQCRKHQTPP